MSVLVHPVGRPLGPWASVRAAGAYIVPVAAQFSSQPLNGVVALLSVMRTSMALSGAVLRNMYVKQ